MKVAFFTASRADYGKIKPVIIEAKKKKIKFTIFATGSHLINEYGKTINQILRDFGKKKIISFSNQKFGDNHQLIFNKTVTAFTKVLKEKNFDCFFIHGDRIETLAAASVLTFSKIKIAHIEGGELSGTVDEMIRHSVSKLSHIHFVTNKAAKKVLINSGENKKNIFITGSPDIDFLKKSYRPNIFEVKQKYGINFENYAISFLHPVTTNTKKKNKKNAEIYFKTIGCIKKFKIIQFIPNNDDHSLIILKTMKKMLSKKKNVKILNSMRFEYYLTLLENCKFIIGNSSSAIMEAPYFNVPAINVGERQTNRFGIKDVINASFNKKSIHKAINNIKKKKFVYKRIFGNGNSAKKIIRTIKTYKFKKLQIQKFYKNLK